MGAGITSAAQSYLTYYIEVNGAINPIAGNNNFMLRAYAVQAGKKYNLGWRGKACGAFPMPHLRQRLALPDLHNFT
jgi:hypothetical protein